MKKLIASIALAALTGISNAALNVYDSFNYATLPNGTPTTGTGETGNWTCGTTPSLTAGLSYAALPTANNALSTTGGRMYAGLATPLTTGTEWVSFLFKCSGDPGGNFDGVYLKGDQTTSLWAGFRGGFNGIKNTFGLASVTSAGTGTTGGTALGSTVNISNSIPHLVVLRIDFNTSAANDTVTLYIDPAANASTPSVAATTTVTTFDVGNISALGVNAQGGTTMTVDEFRVGDTFGDVVGYAPPPAAPTGLTAYPGVNAVGLSWAPTSGASGYVVLRGTNTGIYNTTNFVVANTNYDTTTIGGTTYYFVVEATNSSGSSAFSAEVSATPTTAPPGTPTGFTATGTNQAVLLSWNAATGAASYNVKRSLNSGTEATIVNVATTNYVDTSVVNGTTYFYEISSTNNAGESGHTAELSATPNFPPSAPTGVIATAGTNQVSLAWSGSAGAVSYNIKRSTTSGSGYVTVGTTTAPTVAYLDSTAIKFTQYYYVVSAVNADGESTNSTPEATATTLGSYGPDAYESFNYAVGTLANNTPTTGIGFTGNWTVSGSPSIVAGLTYSNLPTTANAYQHSAAGSQTTENLAAPLSTGTKYISFLMKGSGNSGGDTVGVFFRGNNANSLFAGFYNPYSAGATGFGLGTVNSTTLGGATGLGSTVPINNTSVHLIVLEIQFNTSGVNDTVSLWIDPPAGVIAPGVAANVVNSSFDVGTISAFGINITGGYNPLIDEVRVGDVYGDVVGYGSGSTPIVPTSIAISVAQGEQVTWTAQSANSYQPQRSSDNINWTSFDGLFFGNNTNSVYEAAPQPYYRVLEYLPGGPGANIMVNGSFETTAANSVGAANWNAPASANGINEYVTNQFGALTPTDGSSMLYMEGTNGSGVEVSSSPFPINAGGLVYGVAFDTANPVKLNGANPQYQIEFLDAGNNYVGGSGFQSIAAVGSTWTTISNNYTAPATAVNMRVDFLEAVGGGGDWVTLVDNVRVSALATIASTNVLSPTLQLGASFTGTVISNGVATASLAAGTLTFLTNGVAFSTNTPALGSASSTTAIVTPPYTVTAVYSGDTTYIGSTNTLTVNNATAAVILGDLNQTNNGSAINVSVTTIPAGLTVHLTYNGSASAPTNAGTYQVIGTVSDPLYVGSATNNLVIVSGVSANPTNITASVTGSQLTLSWPADHLGWILQSQTNSLSTGLTPNWTDVSGSSSTTQSVIQIDPANPNVYFRLRSP